MSEPTNVSFQCYYIPENHRPGQMNFVVKEVGMNCYKLLFLRLFCRFLVTKWGIIPTK
ncbi:hypothetical protein KsCSTR_37430 [Candidatus Kuenenia stuttgartiensis]|uniref:Uncharacterized protein n=1 Tax=Kuenenia stuttgartiensis TaxID=174633 RepID=Q1Q685_KUEST|nr:hypothetical protein KsCSTR_37430 [Candidatus Kuenenia stuttgartiensis]CAJ73078.1 unknown protein [Candidatus Kuenenia stuttgartiensis]